ncbi:MAG TPA: FixH family protein [Usitatibacter sp.]|nr:FixH family protein [Usitatibacter sp.]
MPTAQAPWYRHPWPWILMSGPAIVVAAGLFTSVLAVRSFDGLVADDYYKQGLAINRVLDRTRRAAEMHVAARFGFEGTTVRVGLSGAPGESTGLRLTLRHPSLAAHDESITLSPLGGGVYEGRLAEAPQGVSRIVLEDREGLWRLEGAMRGLPPLLTLGTPGPRP